jgi:D-alanyl-D-alanine carboxypeptidase
VAGPGAAPGYVSRVLSSALEAERGGYLYSNAGYVVAGAMLEAAGGAPWEELVAREVFAPLGLSVRASARRRATSRRVIAARSSGG